MRGGDGERYVRRTSVRRLSRSGGETLSILVSVDDGTHLGRLRPLAEELLLASPDRQMVGEYTRASEGDDPRRYAWPRRRRSS